MSVFGDLGKKFATIRRVQNLRCYIDLWRQHSRAEAKLQTDFENFVGMAAGQNQDLDISWDGRSLVAGKDTLTTAFDRHYVYFPGWAIRKLLDIKPQRHVDLGSALSFVAAASALTRFEFYDIRPANLQIDGLSCGQADLKKLPFRDGELESVSCLHVIEHVGLGRYGDELDPEGDRKALEEIRRVLRPGGDFLLVVPMGSPRIEFNAHRIYGKSQLLSRLPEFEVKDFSLVSNLSEGPHWITSPSEEDVSRESWGCGCLHLVKRAE